MLWDQFGLLDTTQTSTRAVYREVGRPKGDDQSVQKHLEWLKKIHTSSEAKDGSVEQLQACTRRTLLSKPFTNIDARNR